MPEGLSPVQTDRQTVTMFSGKREGTPRLRGQIRVSSSHPAPYPDLFALRNLFLLIHEELQLLEIRLRLPDVGLASYACSYARNSDRFVLRAARDQEEAAAVRSQLESCLLTGTVEVRILVVRLLEHHLQLRKLLLEVVQLHTDVLSSLLPSLSAEEHVRGSSSSSRPLTRRVKRVAP